jgi:hypothetical protein
VLVAGVVMAALFLTAGPFGAMRADAAVPVLLGTAGDYAVLAGTPHVTNTGPSVITGDVGVSPALALIGLTGAPDGTVIGAQLAGAAVDGAKLDLTTAYDQAANMVSTPVATQLGNTAPVPGAYNDSGAGLNLTGTITLDGAGSYDSVWVFKSSSSLITGTGAVVSLINGAQACNVYWQVTSSATIESGVAFAGTVLALTSITANTGATVNGRLLARNGMVSLDNNVITRPATCLTGAVDSGDGDGDGDGDNEVGGVTADGTGGLLALSGTDSTPGLIGAGVLLAIGIGAVALGRRLNPRGAHRLH